MKAFNFVLPHCLFYPRHFLQTPNGAASKVMRIFCVTLSRTTTLITDALVQHLLEFGLLMPQTKQI